MADPILELETRRRIFDHIVDHPGSYLRELQRALALPMGMLEYHLDRLERAGLVTVLREEHKRYFPQSMPAQEKRDLALLRQDACRRIVLEVLAQPHATRAALGARTHFRPSTLSYYLTRLVASGLLACDTAEREYRYDVADPERMMALLVRHRPGFMDRFLDGFLDSFEGLQPRGARPP